MIFFCSEKEIVPAFCIPQELGCSWRLTFGEMLNYLQWSDFQWSIEKFSSRNKLFSIFSITVVLAGLDSKEVRARA